MYIYTYVERLALILLQTEFVGGVLVCDDVVAVSKVRKTPH